MLCKYLYDFCKGYSVQHCPILLIAKYRNSVDSGGASSAPLTDLSKAYGCLPHEPLPSWHLPAES